MQLGKRVLNLNQRFWKKDIFIILPPIPSIGEREIPSLWLHGWPRSNSQHGEDEIDISVLVT